MEGVETLDDVSTVAQKIIEELSCPFFLVNGSTVKIGCSVGIAFFPAHGETWEDLLARADQALYHVKKSGKGRWKIYNSDCSI